MANRCCQRRDTYWIVVFNTVMHAIPKASQAVLSKTGVPDAATLFAQSFSVRFEGGGPTPSDVPAPSRCCVMSTRNQCPVAGAPAGRATASDDGFTPAANGLPGTGVSTPVTGLIRAAEMP